VNTALAQSRQTSSNQPETHPASSRPEAALPISALTEHLGGLKDGLSAQEAAGRLSQYGYAALNAKLALQARVKRGGAWSTIPARELVPRDIVGMSDAGTRNLGKRST
jgi:hypothetical protein